MSSSIVDPKDPRFDVLKGSRNLRWPSAANEYASSVEICDSVERAAEALQRAVNSGKRPTVRSGGHCYEDFVVNNPNGTILDLSLLTASRLPGDEGRFRIAAGQCLGDAYTDLYKRYNVTVPAGTCYTVGAGGHISGGGYGLLSRLHGLTVDLLSAVDILTVEANGKVVARRVDKKNDPHLFRACRGAGGGNFGLITGFLFDKLPPAPTEVINAGVSFAWAEMTEDRFVSIILKYGNYWETRGKDPDTWGLFSVLNLSHSSSREFGVSLQFCNPDGTCNDLGVVNEFLGLFDECTPNPGAPATVSDRVIPAHASLSQPCGTEKRPMQKRVWIEATVGGGHGDRRTRAKYKSAYMKRNFSVAEAKCIYRYLKTKVPGVDLSGFVFAIDSYGGATNKAALAQETSAPQRASIMKLQYQSYWQNQQDDAGRLQWLKDFYTELYSGPKIEKAVAGTPYPGEYYEGCYINYPDVDMLAYKFWPQLYYGAGDLYPFLQDVKRRYDPNNVFHHAMSVRA